VYPKPCVEIPFLKDVIYESLTNHRQISLRTRIFLKKFHKFPQDTCKKVNIHGSNKSNFDYIH
jgi:hypothetical protein